MKTVLKIVVGMLLLAALALPLAGLASAAPARPDAGLDRPIPLQGPQCTGLILGGNCTLGEGETLESDLVVMGGNADLQAGSTVEGDVVLMGGNLTADGLIEGDVAVMGGLVSLGETAVVEGSVITIGGHVERAEGATIEGDEMGNLESVLPLVIPGRIQIPGFEGVFPFVAPGGVHLPPLDVRVNPVAGGLWLLLRSFMWAALAVLVVLFVPQHTQRAAQAAASQPLAAGGLGCMTVVVLPLLLAILAITICGIPISLLGVILLLVAWAFGLIAVGLEVGKRLAGLVNRDWALPVSAGLGTFLLTLVINGIGALVPCVGWLAPALVVVVGLGAVLLTRFGARAYPPQAAPSAALAAAPLPPAPPAAEIPPATQGPDEPSEPA
jgi:hypothetical protein